MVKDDRDKAHKKFTKLKSETFFSYKLVASYGFKVRVFLRPSGNDPSSQKTPEINTKLWTQL